MMIIMLFGPGAIAADRHADRERSVLPFRENDLLFQGVSTTPEFYGGR